MRAIVEGGRATRKEALLPYTAAMKNNNEYYPWFDWLRFSLALIVMFGHGGLIHI